MKPDRLKKLVQEGEIETYQKDQVFYALDFKEELYAVKKGYVKRYQVTEDDKRVIESIYGPGYIFPLTQVYKKLFQFDLSQDSVTYLYQAMTDVEIQGISSEQLVSTTTDTPEIYIDLFYEAGRRLRANINRLASNALKDDYQKVSHQIAYLAEEFGVPEEVNGKPGIKIKVPLKPIDMAEQLNISVGVADAVMSRLEKQGVLRIKGQTISVIDAPMLKDAYLR
jgi:CRP-like cAMP-binding protein